MAFWRRRNGEAQELASLYLRTLKSLPPELSPQGTPAEHERASEIVQGFVDRRDTAALEELIKSLRSLVKK